MNKRVKIRNRSLPKEPRVFDVTVNENGEILRYDLQNIKGSLFIEEDDLKQQIKEALEIKDKVS